MRMSIVKALTKVEKLEKLLYEVNLKPIFEQELKDIKQSIKEIEEVHREILKQYKYPD